MNVRELHVIFSRIALKTDLLFVEVNNSCRRQKLLFDSTVEAFSFNSISASEKKENSCTKQTENGSSRRAILHVYASVYTHAHSLGKVFFARFKCKVDSTLVEPA